MSSAEQVLKVESTGETRRLFTWRPTRKEGWILVGVASFLVVVFVLLSAGYWWVQRGHVYNGVSVRGVPLGHATEQEARVVVERTAAEFLAQPVQLAVQEKAWQANPNVLGARVDVEQTLHNVIAVGRSGSFFANISQVLNAARRGTDVGMVVHYDSGAVRDYLEQLAPQVHREPVPGNVHLEGIKVVVQPGVPGRDLDVARAVGVAARGFGAPAGQRVELPILSLPPALSDLRLRQVGDQATSLLDGPHTLRWEQSNWQLTPEQVAASMSYPETRDSAGTITDLNLAIDEAKLKSYLEPLVPNVGRAGKDASVQLASGEPEVVVSQPGIALDVAASASRIKEDLLGGKQETQLVTVPTIPGISDEQAQEVAAVSKKLLSQPMLFSHSDKKWEIAPDALQGMLTFARIEDESHKVSLQPRLDPAKLQAFLDGIAPSVYQEPVNGRVDWNGGSLRMQAPGTDGKELDVAATMASVDTGLPQGQQAFQIQTKPVPPKVREDTLQTLGIVELVAKGTSNFRGSAADRAQNIKTAVGYLDGAVIAPGEEFSFLGTIGPVTKERGFVDGLTIVADQTIPGVGGGVCQVSTTTFRAAFWSGLPITSRAQHAYRVGYYEQGGDPVGFDAAVWEPEPDFKFINQTSAHLLVDTNITDGILTVFLYGTKPGWEVTMKGPYVSNPVPAPPPTYVDDPKLAPGTEKKVDSAHDGLDVSIVRVITQNGQTVREDKFNSHFRAWPAVFHRGPQPNATPSPSPTDGQQLQVAPSPNEQGSQPQPQPTVTQPAQLM